MYGSMISTELPGNDGWGKNFDAILPRITTELHEMFNAPHPFRIVAEFKVFNVEMIEAFGQFYAKEISEGRTVLEPLCGMAVEIKKGTLEGSEVLFMNLVSFTDIRTLQLFMEILYGIYQFKTPLDLTLTVFGVEKPKFSEE